MKHKLSDTLIIEVENSVALHKEEITEGDICWYKTKYTIGDKSPKSIYKKEAATRNPGDDHLPAFL